MKILLVNPQTPLTFWSFKYALKFVSRKSSEPPLGLLTVAAMLPKEWEKKLVDLNIEKLRDKEILWADFVFITGMDIQRESFIRVVEQCNRLERKVVAGGPMCTMDPGQFEEVEGLRIDHFVLNEAELTLPMFLSDLKEGKPKHMYTSHEFPDITQTPVPAWNLLKMKKYASMSIQYSRGCPFNCEFCSIGFLNGHRTRTKSAEQFVNELDSLYRWGWRGGVFIVDDNFIGNKEKLKREVLPAMREWQREKKYPFSFITEASINIADDDELINLMTEAGFDSAFIGIETVNEESLNECGKNQNKHRDILAAVRKLQNRGISVSGGFIVGFDNDTPEIFEQQKNFIQKSGIVTAMVGLLNAPQHTRLFERLKRENRIVKSRIDGNNMDMDINFIPKMDMSALKEGYRQLLEKIYSPAQYYERVKTFLNNYEPAQKYVRVPLNHIGAFLKAIWKLGIVERGRLLFWKLIIKTLIRYPQKISTAVTMAIYGFHFRKVVEKI